MYEVETFCMNSQALSAQATSHDGMSRTSRKPRHQQHPPQLMHRSASVAPLPRPTQLLRQPSALHLLRMHTHITRVSCRRFAACYAHGVLHACVASRQFALALAPMASPAGAMMSHGVPPKLKPRTRIGGVRRFQSCSTDDEGNRNYSSTRLLGHAFADGGRSNS